MECISIIVPVYNAGTGLERCINSIINQTYSLLDIILVDDGSTDDSLKICKRYQQSDQRIHVISQKNKGVSEARNAGIRSAKGAYISFVDSDDYLSHDYIEALYNRRADLTISGIVIEDEQERVLKYVKGGNKSYKKIEEIDYSYMYEKLLIYSPYSKLFRSDIIQKQGLFFRKELTWGEDGAFVSNYLKYVESIEILGKTPYHHIRYKDDTLSTKIRINIVDTIVKARELCISDMKSISPDSYWQVKEICEEDIKNNCAYFVTQLLASKELSKHEKIVFLEKFMENTYTQNILKNSQHYFAYNKMACLSLQKKDAKKIVEKYIRLERQHNIYILIYYKIYQKLPGRIKKSLNKMLKVIKNK